MGRGGQGVGERCLGSLKLVGTSAGLPVVSMSQILFPDLILQTLGYSHQLTSGKIVLKEDPTWVLPELGLGRAAHPINPSASVAGDTWCCETFCKHLLSASHARSQG